MKEYPILFSGPMVRAILDGRKMQTRRPFLPRGKKDCPFCEGTGHEEAFDGERWGRDYRRLCRCISCPYGQPGDLLWVRETWAPNTVLPIEDRPPGEYIYRADDIYSATWHPSIHMPRWASRLILRITNVRVQRVQEISSADAIAEGFTTYATYETVDCETENPRDDFIRTWDSLNAKRGYGWDTNPWVWAISFERVMP